MGWLKKIGGFALYIFNPAQSFLSDSTLRVKNFFVYFEDIRDLKSQLAENETKIENLTLEKNILKEKIELINLTEEQIKFLDEKNYQFVSTKVIAVNSDQNTKSITVNRGSQHNINKNNVVITSGGVLIGKVYSVSDFTSKILLINDNRSQISAIVQNDSKTPGLVSGRFGLTLNMQLIPQGMPIATNDTIVTSGSEPGIPPNLLIGKVQKITKISGNLFQEATIEPLANLQNLYIVSVISSDL